MLQTVWVWFGTYCISCSSLQPTHLGYIWITRRQKIKWIYRIRARVLPKNRGEPIGWYRVWSTLWIMKLEKSMLQVAWTLQQENSRCGKAAAFLNNGYKALMLHIWFIRLVHPDASDMQHFCCLSSLIRQNQLTLKKGWLTVWNMLQRRIYR
jgi:hypothetical protein